MSAQEKQFNPSDLSNEQLDRMAFALLGKINKFLVVETPLTREEAAAFTKLSVSRFDELVRAGKFRIIKPYHNSHPTFLPSMLIEDMKSWKS
jgi:hypothetical protein